MGGGLFQGIQALLELSDCVGQGLDGFLEFKELIDVRGGGGNGHNENTCQEYRRERQSFHPSYQFSLLSKSSSHGKKLVIRKIILEEFPGKNHAMSFSTRREIFKNHYDNF
jgi:hypothetical protein